VTTRRLFFSAACCLALVGISPPTPAAAPTAADLAKAIETGDFAAYQTSADAWITERSAGAADQASLLERIADPEFRRVLDQRALIAACGVDKLGAFAKADAANRSLLGWLLADTAALDLLLEGAVPLQLAARDRNELRLSVNTLEILSRIVAADADAKAGLPLRLALATSLAPPGTGAPGAGHGGPVDPVARYKHFKEAHAAGELVPSFPNLGIWELQKVVQSGASNEDLAWGRQMIRSFRPDLLTDEMVVNSTSFVWRRNAPPKFYPFKGMKDVLAGGGKCGPRSSWSVFICQAFGVPAIGVGQPAHACVAYKAANPMLEPQPGSAWKVGFGRGWQVSKLENMSGPEFLEAVAERARAKEFSQIEHLRWLAAALADPTRAAAVREVAAAIRGSLGKAETDLTASLKPEEAEADPGVKAAANDTATSKKDSASEPAPPAGPVTAKDGVIAVPAAAFTATGGEISWGGQFPNVLVMKDPAGERQIHFQPQMKSQWADYSIEAPAEGAYELVMDACCVNDEQALELVVAGGTPVVVSVPLTYGLWTETPPVEVRLAKGVQTIRLQSPADPKRGISVRSFVLKPKA